MLFAGITVVLETGATVTFSLASELGGANLSETNFLAFSASLYSGTFSHEGKLSS